ncbi:prolyl oligopeptidase family serine peptidase [Edaphobacter aggregans]|uniref:prolyl oligopeptidase family serine peptidase n=1 Tax=Edaphobacter aggregans TaxID=570835 RepID=UPI00054D7A51|nr:prolyl oligopeptidase family serine peptidase [Edaphobacter aggregans]
MFRRITVAIITINAIAGCLFSQTRRAVTIQDCVTVQYLLRDSLRPSLQMNPQGDRVAYLVKSPNLRTNHNDIELYVGSLGATGTPQVKLVLTNEDAASLQWEGDGRHVVLLMTVNGHRSLEEIDTSSGVTHSLLNVDEDVVEYSITPDGRTIAFATENATNNPNIPDLPRTPDESERGYRIQFASSSRSPFSTRRVYIARRLSSNRWTSPKQIAIRSPLTSLNTTDIPYAGELGLSLSPSGTRLLFRYIDSSTERPPSWQKSEFVQKGLVETGFSGTPLLALYDDASGMTSIPLQSPFPNGLAVWSPDSNAFIIKAQSPVNSKWEADDIKLKRLLASKGEHLFWVHIPSHTVSRITPFDAQLEELASWKDNTVVVRTAPDQLSVIAQNSEKFDVVRQVAIPIVDLSPYSQISGDGNVVVVEDQNLVTPPRLLLFRPNSGQLENFADLNPQFQSLMLTPTRQVQWTLPDGYPAQGILFTPPDYDPGTRYPLVISATVYGGGFACDSGDLHLAAFVPVPLAEAGILYLMRTYPVDWTLMRQQEHYPQGYPGGISEAVFQTELWDSAVNSLSEQGVIDRSRVGIIGFSRTGWYTEFALVHGKTPYKAATAVDNVKYGLAEYWLSPKREGTIRGFDAMYGGPPYGSTRSAWEQYSISFNLEKIHTPLLMEQMGYGRQYDRSTIIPVPLESSMELFAGLKRLNKPVDFFYYPNEDHQPDHPLARLSSLQRNLDWFRFWLQGFEDDNPEKRTEYKLWREMKDRTSP